MLILKTKNFDRWARREDLSDQKLLSAVEELERGLVEAPLGGHLVKKRIAAIGRGKSGS